MINRFRQLYNYYFSAERFFVQTIWNIAGVIPVEVTLYKLAFTHTSLVKEGRQTADSNERLEFLGDAALGSIIAELLYRKYPYKNEGFLTEMRAKLVNRNQLNEIALKLGFDVLLQYDAKHGNFPRSILGNTLEAFIGAIYLDLGYAATRKFILYRMLPLYQDLTQIADMELNYKSKLMELAQKHRLEPIQFELIEVVGIGSGKQFKVALKIAGKELASGVDSKKKFAEQRASEMALIRFQKEPELITELQQQSGINITVSEMPAEN